MAKRLGGTSSGTRALLLDAAERLLLSEGYAAVTSRRVAADAGVKPQLVHYYFASMDDLFLEVYRRRAEQGIEGFVRAMEVQRSLWTVWRFGSDLRAGAFNIEFAALANHRKTIRDEMARYARRFRKLQLDAIAGILADYGVSRAVCPPVVALLAMTGITQIMAIEEVLDVADGHVETVRFIEDLIRTVEHDHAVTGSRGPG